MKIKEWQIYENDVFNLFRSTGNYCEKNVITQGVRSNHQIDVLLRLEAPLKNHLWLIECKKRSRPIGKNELQSFKTIIDDIGADHGFILSEKGFQKGAKRMAKSLNITLTSYSYLNRLFLEEQLKPDHPQSKMFYTFVEEEEDCGNMDSEAILVLKSTSPKFKIIDYLIEMHVFHEGLYWNLSNEKCKKFILELDVLKISIPWNLPNLELEEVSLKSGGCISTGNTKSGILLCGRYRVIFRTLSGPVYVTLCVPSFK